MPGKIIMVTGGARSGKSEFAERYVSVSYTHLTLPTIA